MSQVHMPLPLRCNVAHVELRDMIQILDPCVRPIMWELRLLVDFIMLPSVQD